MVYTGYVGHGRTLTLEAPTGGVTGGVPLMINNLFVIPVISADVGKVFACDVTGVHKLDKATGQSWGEGDAIYWSSADSNATTNTSGTRIGIAVRAADSSDTTGLVRLNGVATV